MPKYFKQILILLTMTALLVMPFFVFANDDPCEGKGVVKKLECAAKGAYKTEQPATGASQVSQIVGTVINAALSLLGVIFLVLTIYGGYLWMTAAGNEDQVKKARDIITRAIIGLVVVIGAYAITTFVTTYVITKEIIQQE